jgi:hypothetical protein
MGRRFSFAWRARSEARYWYRLIIIRSKHAVLLAPWWLFRWRCLSRAERKLLRQVPPDDVRSIADSIRAWIIGVTNTVDEPLGPEHGDLDELVEHLYDYEGAITDRASIDDLLDSLPGELTSKLQTWLAHGPDATFVDLTEPDPDNLLARAGMGSNGGRKPWDVRVPKRGLVRALLEREAERLNGPAPD